MRNFEMFQIITLVSMTFIVVSIFGFCLETHAWGRTPVASSEPAASTTSNKLDSVNGSSVDPDVSTESLPLDYMAPPFYYPGGPGLPKKAREKTVPKKILTILDYVCSIWFTVEFIARLLFCPDRVLFFKTMLNIIDLLAIVPFYVQILADKSDFVVSMWEIIKVLRIFRVFKLCRHVVGLKVLVHTLRASAKELILLIVFLVLGVVVFSSLQHYVEYNNAYETLNGMSQFDSIPGGFWWAVITMTTIGYGDEVPQTNLGRFVGALCAICGVLTISLPVPVIVNNFTLYYNHAQARLKLPKKRKIDKLAGAAEALKYQKSEDYHYLNEKEVTTPSGDCFDSDFETTALFEKENKYSVSPDSPDENETRHQVLSSKSPSLQLESRNSPDCESKRVSQQPLTQLGFFAPQKLFFIFWRPICS